MWEREGYQIYVSSRKNKKYDVYDGNKYICSFGYGPMQQYRDKLGHYSDLDHNDEKRRKAFKSRFKKLIDKKDKNKPTYWSNAILW